MTTLLAPAPASIPSYARISLLASGSLSLLAAFFAGSATARLTRLA